MQRQSPLQILLGSMDGNATHGLTTPLLLKLYPLVGNLFCIFRQRDLDLKRKRKNDERKNEVRGYFKACNRVLGLIRDNGLVCAEIYPFLDLRKICPIFVP